MGTVLYEVGFQMETGMAILLIVMVGFPLILISKWRELPVAVKIFFSIACAFLLLVCAAVIKFQFDMYSTVMDAYKTGQYQTVEGYVENFDPLESDERGLESFEINGISFFYSDTNVITGYHNTQKNGGVIAGNGQYLKIGYIYYDDSYGNIIVYIEEPDSNGYTQ